MVCAFRSTGVCGGLMFFYTQTNTKVDKNKNHKNMLTLHLPNFAVVLIQKIQDAPD